jgi:hypothetical protein
MLRGEDAAIAAIRAACQKLGMSQAVAEKLSAPPQTADPEPERCSCDEALALRARLDKAERRAKLWRKVAHIKHRLLHLAEPKRFDSQLERPVR